MNELYWISVVGKLRIVFEVGVGFCFIVIFVAIVKGICEDDFCPIIRTCKRYGIIALVLSLCAIMMPSKQELYLIYGAGTILDYCKGDSKVKEIPDKAIDALNRYLDRMGRTDLNDSEEFVNTFSAFLSGAIDTMEE